MANAIGTLPTATTPDAQVTVVPLLRPVDVPTEKLTVVVPAATWPDDAAVDHALGAYGPDGSAA